MLSIHPQTVNLIFIYFLLAVVLFTSLRLANGDYKSTTDTTKAFLFLLFLLLLMGLRPYNVPGVGRYFGDTINYYRIFQSAASGLSNFKINDPGFSLFTEFCAKNMGAAGYFFILSALYLLPAWFAIKRFSPNNTLLLLLLYVSSILFWSNGVNGIRIGIASSLFLLAVTYAHKRWMQAIIFILALTFHKSILLPIMAYILTLFYSNSKVYIYWWLLSIGLSLLLGGFWENFFASFNLGDERFSGYLTKKPDAGVFAYIGFRWDFLVYSAIPVVLGAIYILKKHYTEKIYIQLFNTYLVANSFWILVIRANYSNRFASLSWFLMPILLLIPLLNLRIWPKQESIIALMLILSYSFTYYMAF
jgi:hypothetical protein